MTSRWWCLGTTSTFPRSPRTVFLRPPSLHSVLLSLILPEPRHPHLSVSVLPQPSLVRRASPFLCQFVTLAESPGWGGDHLTYWCFWRLVDKWCFVYITQKYGIPGACGGLLLGRLLRWCSFLLWLTSLSLAVVCSRPQVVCWFSCNAWINTIRNVFGLNFTACVSWFVKQGSVCGEFWFSAEKCNETKNEITRWLNK